MTVHSKAQLTQRLKDLESRLEVISSQSPPNVVTGSEAVAQQELDRSLTTSAISLMTEERRQAPQSFPAIESDEEANVDVLATEAFNEEAETGTGYFGSHTAPYIDTSSTTDPLIGPSSNHAFFRAISDTFARILGRATRKVSALRINETRVLDKTPQEKTSQTPGRSHRSTSSSFSTLPPESEVLRLLDCYFASVGSMLPFVSKPALLGDYRRLRYEDTGPQSRVKRALLNVAFALASATLADGSSETFYHRSLACLDERRLRGASVELGTLLPKIHRSQYTN